MIPLRDDLGRRGLTPVVWTLAAVWIAMFVVAVRLSDRDLAALQARLGLQAFDWWRASEVVVGGRRGGHFGAALGALVVPLLGYQLVHGGFVAVLSNALFLVVFGGRLEARAGSLRFLAFHLLAGVLVAFAQIAWVARSQEVVVGASGAVAASMVAYALLYRRSRVVMVVPVLVVPVFVEIPALVLLAVFAVFQLRPLVCLLGVGPAVPLSWQGYAGGIVAGAVLLPLLFVRRGGRR